MKMSATEWRTRDMALVAFLICSGLNAKRLEIENTSAVPSCYWVFEESDDLPDQLMTYMEGKALVEPNQFNTTFAKLKRDMFDFMRSQGVGTARRRT